MLRILFIPNLIAHQAKVLMILFHIVDIFKSYLIFINNSTKFTNKGYTNDCKI
jgi:hypothetical protein